MKHKIGISFLLICFWVCQLEAQEKNYAINIPGTDFSIKLVHIPSGAFKMGTAEDAAFRNNNEHQSPSISMDAFYMSSTEITYDQFLAFREREYDASETKRESQYDADATTRPSPPYLDFTYGMGNRDGFPAVSMTQQAALRYCEWLYDKTGVFFRLPTEAEWEYACRAGTSTTFYFGDDIDELDDYAWHYDNSSEKYHKVGEKEPNAWGLYDMLGNVAEYTLDQYQFDFALKMDPSKAHELQTTPKGKYRRTVKGGAYDDTPEDCRCAYRIASNPAWQARDPQIPKSTWWNPDSPFVGFRIVQPTGEWTEAEVRAFFKKVIID